VRGTRRVSGTGRGREEVGWVSPKREQLWPWLNLCFSVEALFCAGLAILLIVCINRLTPGVSIFYCLDSMAFSQGNGLNDCVY